jgi:hypothetical protein
VNVLALTFSQKLLLITFRAGVKCVRNVLA